jgi:hypothetical protein
MTLLSTLFRRSEKRHALSSLMSLDDRMLADIGLTRSDVYQMMGPTRGRTIRSHEKASNRGLQMLKGSDHLGALRFSGRSMSVRAAGSCSCPPARRP